MLRPALLGNKTDRLVWPRTGDLDCAAGSRHGMDSVACGAPRTGTASWHHMRAVATLVRMASGPSARSCLAHWGRFAPSSELVH